MTQFVPTAFVKIKRLRQRSRVPHYMTSGAAGADLSACLKFLDDEPGVGPLTLPAGCTVLVPTGVAIEIPFGFEGQIRGRSSLGRSGICVAQGVGTIDCDYRGEVFVALHNHSKIDFLIADGDRIAQLVIAPVVQALFEEVDELGNTERGDGSFGSTGRGA